MSSPKQTNQSRGWLDRIFQLGQPEPETQEELVQVLREAQQRNILDQDALDTIVRVIQISELHVRDVMIPRAQMVMLERQMTPGEMLPIVIESAHSRFPVIDHDKDVVIGLLLAKDLLRYFDPDSKDDFWLKDVLRPPVFVPESKRLNILLAEFRSSRNHMAVVVDEYGGIGGLVTIEDVLEQIVGDIEDEHDYDDDGAMILQRSEGDYVIKALLEIEDFNERFSADFADEDFSTIGGLVVHEFGHVPKRGEKVKLDSFEFEVLNADSRRVHLLKMTCP